MAHAYRLGFAILLGAIASPAQALAFGPGEAAGGFHPTRADFKVLIWYRLDDPLGTFKYQVYDVRKGEYTPAVDRWIVDVQKKYSGYLVVVRDVDLLREKGATEQLRVGAVIRRDIAVAAASAGIVAEGIGVPLAPTSLRSAARTIGANRVPGGINRMNYANPPTSGFPVPIPYPHLPR
jgi:hypothetical protein